MLCAEHAVTFVDADAGVGGNLDSVTDSCAAVRLPMPALVLVLVPVPGHELEPELRPEREPEHEHAAPGLERGLGSRAAVSASGVGAVGRGGMVLAVVAFHEADVVNGV